MRQEPEGELLPICPTIVSTGPPPRPPRQGHHLLVDLDFPVLWVSLPHRDYSIIEVVRVGKSEDMTQFCDLIQRQRLPGDAVPGFAFLAPDKL